MKIDDYFFYWHTHIIPVNVIDDRVNDEGRIIVGPKKPVQTFVDIEV